MCGVVAGRPSIFTSRHHAIGEGLFDGGWVQRQIACLDPDGGIGVIGVCQLETEFYCFRPGNGTM